jgi:hypothetical protein
MMAAVPEKYNMEVAGGLLDQKDAYGRTNERIANMAC